VPAASAAAGADPNIVPSADSASIAAAPTATSVEVPPLATDFSRLPDGGPIPRLPDSAPKEVNFGVILVAYQGAEAAPKTARTREQARKYAEDLIARAKADFNEAAKLGDHGSNANAGQIPRGILEPAVEFALFTLSEGGVYDAPLDTPRGFWVVKRNK
jgi:hypothetical protein